MLKEENSGLVSNNNVLEQEKQALTGTVHELSDRVLQLSNEKIDISIIRNDSSQKIMHKYGSEMRNELQTIKEIMNSQNEIEEDHPHGQLDVVQAA